METETFIESLLKKKKAEIKFKKTKTPIEDFYHKVKHCEPDIFAPLKKYPGPHLITEFVKLPSWDNLTEKTEHLTAINLSKAIAIVTNNIACANANNLHRSKQALRGLVLHIDTHIEPYQIYESRFLNAHLITLSLSVLSMIELSELFLLAKEQGLETFVNICNRRELDLAFNTATNFFSIDRESCFGVQLDIPEIKNLVQYIPKDKFVVCRMTKINQQELQELTEAEVDIFILPPPKNKNETAVIKEIFNAEDS